MELESSPQERLALAVAGIVQGVGFRPFVHRLAVRLGLTGFVRNSQAGVEIEVQGNSPDLQEFLRALRAEAPAEARVIGIGCRPLPLKPRDDEGFVILASKEEGAAQTALPPDLATCSACRAELADPAARRHRYPFTNCTGCGPRFTIVTALPYDRPHTTMADFAICPACAFEYHDPADRRFHAQPIACPACGPSAVLMIADQASGVWRAMETDDPVRAAGEALRRGAIGAVKGLGGFHLAGDAARDETVVRLRRIKSREAKPLAVMCQDLEQVRRICRLSSAEADALVSAVAPIVILDRLDEAGLRISEFVAPGRNSLGVMLPYTPLHHLLLAEMRGPLVMTSANPGESPIAKGFEELDPEIAGKLDFILTHDRPIQARCDDSVLIAAPVPILLRRSRGYVPAPIGVSLKAEVLGVGGDQKNTACFIRDGQAFLTQHIGTVEDEKALRAWREAIGHFQALFGLRPRAAACDPHPGYLTRQAAAGLGLPVVEVQHHWAHIAACLTEHGYQGRAIGVAMDGSGYGPDGTVWGGEFLLADLTDCTRVGSLRPVALPGGEKAVREPWRMALAYLYDTYGHTWPDFPCAGEIAARGGTFLLPAVAAGVNAPATTSAGRLFDAVAALLGLCQVCTYEGQAAAGLEDLARQCHSRPSPLPYEISFHGGRWQLDLRPLVRRVVAGCRSGRARAEIAMACHLALAGGIRAICEKLRDGSGLNTVALSGGVFQNVILLTETVAALQGAGFTVLCHQQVPPNDGGLSLGQAAIAAAKLEKGDL